MWDKKESAVNAKICRNVSPRWSSSLYDGYFRETMKLCKRSWSISPNLSLHGAVIHSTVNLITQGKLFQPVNKAYERGKNPSRNLFERSYKCRKSFSKWFRDLISNPKVLIFIQTELFKVLESFRQNCLWSWGWNFLFFAIVNLIDGWKVLEILLSPTSKQSAEGRY